MKTKRMVKITFSNGSSVIKEMTDIEISVFVKTENHPAINILGRA